MKDAKITKQCPICGYTLQMDLNKPLLELMFTQYHMRNIFHKHYKRCLKRIDSGLNEAGKFYMSGIHK